MLAVDTGFEAQAIFQQGPEILISSSRTIVAGPPSGLVKRVDKESGGATPIPVDWTISGVLVKPILLKGPSAPRSLEFRRQERALFTIMDSATPQWELDLGSLEQAASVVLFYHSDAAAEPSKVLPSPRGGIDFVLLVSDIVRIQSIPGAPDRLAAWSEYALSAPANEGRTAALRSLVASGAPWPTLAATWGRILADTKAPAEVRAFAFKLMLLEVSIGHWPESRRDIVALSQRVFMAEANGRLALDYADGLLMLYNAARQNPDGLPGSTEAVCRTLRDRETLGPDTDEHSRAVNEAYRKLRESCLASAPPPPKR